MQDYTVISTDKDGEVYLNYVAAPEACKAIDCAVEAIKKDYPDARPHGRVVFEGHITPEFIG